MKMIFLGLVLVLGQVNSYAQKFSLNCTSKLMNDSTMLILDIPGQGQISAIFKNGTATITGEINEPKVATVLVDHTKERRMTMYGFWVLLSPGEISVKINNTDGDNYTDLKGNNIAMDYEYQLVRKINFCNAKRDSLAANYQRAVKAGSADSARIRKEKETWIYKCYQVPQVYIRANPKSPVCIAAIQMLGNGDAVAKVDVHTLKELFDLIALNIRATTAGRQYEDRLNAILAQTHKP